MRLSQDSAEIKKIVTVLAILLVWEYITKDWPWWVP